MPTTHKRTNIFPQSGIPKSEKREGEADMARTSLLTAVRQPASLKQKAETLSYF